MKTVIFDFDGTLADTFPLVFSIFQKVGKTYGLPDIKDFEIDEYRKIGVKEIVKKFNLPLLKVVLLGLHIRFLMRRELKNIRLFDGIPELLEKLPSNGHQMLIFSSNSKSNILEVLRANGVVNIPEIYSEVSILNKARGLERIINSNGLSRDKTVYVGDEVRDYEATKAVGVEFVGVGWGYNSINGLRKAGVKKIFDETSQLQKYLLRF